MPKVNNKSGRKRCEVCSKLALKTPVFLLLTVNFEHISHLFLPLFLTLNKLMLAGLSVSKLFINHVFSNTSHSIYLKLFIKLRYLKVGFQRNGIFFAELNFSPVLFEKSANSCLIGVLRWARMGFNKENVGFFRKILNCNSLWRSVIMIICRRCTEKYYFS